MNPADLLDSSRILLGIDGRLPKEEVIRRLVAAAMQGCNGSTQRIVAELLEREKKMTTGIGRGVAIPHARSERVQEPLAALGVSPAGINYASLDDEPVRIIFMFITPEGTPSLHIRTLAHAVAIFGNVEVRKAIVAAPDPDAVLDIIRKTPVDPEG